jgi:hypothetical protein
MAAALAACSSPSLKYQGTAPHEAEVAGLRVDVYSVPGDKPGRVDAQAIILSGVLGIGAAELQEIAALAIEEAAEGTPCELVGRSIRGASTVWTARLDCA